MPKKPPPPPPYAPEYRRRLIELVRQGRSPESLAKDFEPTAQTIRNWAKQALGPAGRLIDLLPPLRSRVTVKARRDLDAFMAKEGTAPPAPGPTQPPRD